MWRVVRFGRVVTVLCTVAAAWCTALGQYSGLRTLPPARLSIEAPTAPTSSSVQPLRVQLLDADGRPVAAGVPIRLKVGVSGGAVVDQPEVTIPKGASSATVNVKKERPGLTQVVVQQVATQGAVLNAAAQLSFAEEEFVPKSPFAITFGISPGPKLRAGLDVGTIVARMVDANSKEFPARQDYEINFPELGAGTKLSPPVMRLTRGNSFAVASVSYDQPGSFLFKPSVNPHADVLSSVSEVDFVSPIVSAVVIPKHTYIEGIWPPKIEIAVGLTDARGNWFPSDENRVLVLKADPDSDGVFESSQIQIPKGTSAVTSYYTPLREGKAVVKATVRDLQNPEMTIEFRYKLWFFWGLSIIGGICGGIVKTALEGKRGARALFSAAGVGCFTGILTYVLAPALDFKSLDPTVQAGSKTFLAFLYGFIGGGVGFTLFRALLDRFRPAPSQPS